MEDNVNVWKNTSEVQPNVPPVQSFQVPVVKPKVNRLPIVIALSLVVVLLGVILYMLLTSNLNNKPTSNTSLSSSVSSEISSESSLSSVSSSGSSITSSNLSSTKSQTTNSAYVYNAKKVGLAFTLPANNKNTVIEYDQYSPNNPGSNVTLTVPYVSIAKPESEIFIVKYFDSVNYDDYFANEHIPGGGFSISTDKIVGTDIQKAVSYSSDGDMLENGTFSLTYSPTSIVYFNYSVNSKTNNYSKDLYFTVNGNKYIVKVKLNNMSSYSPDPSISNFDDASNNYLSQQNLTEIESIIKSIKAL